MFLFNKHCQNVDRLNKFCMYACITWMLPLEEQVNLSISLTQYDYWGPVNCVSTPMKCCNRRWSVSLSVDCMDLSEVEMFLSVSH